MVQNRFKKLHGTKRKTVKNKTVIHKQDKPSPAICALCGTKLHGVPRKGKAELSKLSKTQKRPERKFGGVLCSSCVTQLVKEKTRLQAGVIGEEEVSLMHLKYIRMMK